MSRIEGETGLGSMGCWVDESTQGFKDYFPKRKEILIIAANNVP